MVKIKYITNVRIPTTRAQGYAVMKMCEEFSMAGANVELVVPNRRSNEKTDDPFLYYGIKNKFPITKLKSFDLLGPFEAFGKLFYWIDMLSFLLSVRFGTKKFDGLFYTRDYLVALVLPKKSFVYLEIHDMPKSKYFFIKALKKIKIFVVLNKYIKDELVGMGVDEKNILVCPSGVEISDFDISINKEDARKKLNLPIDKKIITYTGHFYDWKGVDILALVAKMMPENIFLFIGGVEPDLTHFKNKYNNLENIIILPFMDRKNIPVYLKASDVLVLPNLSKEKISIKYTSPLKMFEYMASKTPIVASDLPSIREVLNSDNCVFAEAGSPESFALAINNLLSNDKLSKDLSSSAFSSVLLYSWGNRAKKILSKINENTL